MVLRYTFVWLILVLAAIVNGIVRQAVYAEYLGDLRAHQTSTLSGIVLFGFIIWGFSRLWPLSSARQAWAVGFFWLTLTVAFEFLFGHFVAGHPWSKLFHDYNLLDGRVWLLILIWVTMAPYFFYRTRMKNEQSIAGRI
jgi:uncharacterized membrane protein